MFSKDYYLDDKLETMAGQLDISATESNVENILSRSDRYTVPDYQRLYSWDEEQWDDFWTDLVNISKDETHFLGSIVVIKHTGAFDQLDRLELVDGQQRLTTISLLLVALREHYESIGDPNGLAEKIDEDYLHVYDMNNEEFQNLELSRFDNPAFSNILDGEENNAEESQLYEALQYFRDKLDDLSDEEADSVRKRLLGSLTMVVIDTENPESAFRLFETLNDRGLELSAVDLMKNSLLQEAMEMYPGGYEDPQYQQVRDLWQSILEDVVREIQKPNRFFRHYMMQAPHPDKDTGISNYKLYDEFRKVIKKELPSNGVTLLDYVSDMEDVSDLYTGFIQANVDVFQSREQQRVNRRLANLNAIQSVHSRTLLLRVFQEFKEFDKIDRTLRLLEVFMTRWKLAGYPSGSKLDTIFASICSNAFDKDDPVDEIKSRLKDEAPDDDEFRVGIISKNFKDNAQTRYVLRTLEHRSFGGVDADQQSVDIEHIAPKRMWSAKKYESWRNILNLSEEEFENEYRNKLGNLTLLENRHNAAAGAKPFDEKKQYYLGSNYEMTQDVREYDDWSKETIDDRTRKLAERAENIWDFDSF